MFFRTQSGSIVREAFPFPVLVGLWDCQRKMQASLGSEIIATQTHMRANMPAAALTYDEINVVSVQIEGLGLQSS